MIARFHSLPAWLAGLGLSVLPALSPAALAQCESTPTGVPLIPSLPISGGRFGSSIGLSGDTIIVGADNPYQSPSHVFIFAKSGGFWTQQASFSSIATALPYYGKGVAILGDLALIGHADNRTVYATARTGTTWSSQQAIPYTESPAYALGSCIAMTTIGTRTVAIAGAPEYNGAYGSQGAAIVFTINPLAPGAAWGEAGFLTASDAAYQDIFGASVAISGSSAIIGAPLSDSAAGGATGSAYVFTGNGFGSGWTQQVKLVASDAQAFDHFGSSVAISGDTAAVGAPNRAPGSIRGSGAVYIFTRTGGTWSQFARIDPGQTDGNFGASVALQNDRLVIGSPLGSLPSDPSDTGYIALYERPAGSGIAGAWTLTSRFVPPVAVSGDSVGAAVVLGGTRIVLGAPTDDYNNQIDAGSISVVDIARPCPADFDCSGSLAVADIFAFLNTWFSGSATADFDGMNGLQVADIFAFLNAWFAGC
jgi:hypothetical protein